MGFGQSIFWAELDLKQHTLRFDSPDPKKAFAGVHVTFRLSDNYLVPSHRVISPERAAELLSKLEIDAKKLPKILAEDPVIVEMEAKKGDIIEIVRASATAGKSVYYRVVE